MPEINENDKKEFIVEKIKERPINKRRLLRRTVITAFMAVLFGLVACFTFLLIEPIITNWLYPPEEPPLILFPEDQEEMSPEEMLADTMLSGMQQEGQQGNDTEGEKEPGEVTLHQEQINEILKSFVMDRTNYRQLYAAMKSYVAELERSMVTVTGFTSDVDWLENVFESNNQSSGVIIAKNEQSIYILTDYKPLEDAELLTVTFCDKVAVEAEVMQFDTMTQLSVIVVDLTILPDTTLEKIQVATLGNSNIWNIIGTPVVAMGSPMGLSGSIGYGMITSEATILSLVDANYKLIYTDIYGSRKAGGILFNMQNEVVGVITDNHNNADLPNTINAYGISELKKVITRLSNSYDRQMPYFGISGVDVSSEAQNNLGLPTGAYVTEVEMNSPAMMAGIRQGDIIIAVGEATITTFNNYTLALMSLEAGEAVEVTVMRLSQGEYIAMDFTVTVGGIGLGE